MMRTLVFSYLFHIALTISILDTPAGRNAEPKVRASPKIRNGCDYCQYGVANTYCKNFQGTSSACKKVLKKGVDEDSKKVILDTHNEYRRTVAKGKEPRMRYEASDMMEFAWDEELARGAQMWANQCLFNHDSNDICRFGVGQNLYIAGLWKGASAAKKSEPKWNVALKSWYEEVSLFKENPTKPINVFHGTGHFTQMIWGSTQFVGCGFIAHTGYNGGDRYDSAYYVCNYGPAGNFLNHKAFSSGKACSQCPASTTCNNGLCRATSGANTEVTKTTSTTTIKTVTTTKKNSNPNQSKCNIPKIKELQQTIKQFIDFC